MSQLPRVRFAPSPTGKVHIGNIRVAILNWLFARKSGGKFLLRVEDTDLERSTPEAVNALFEVMQWLGLDYDEDPVHQTQQVDKHKAAVESLLSKNRAYRTQDESPAVVFRMTKDLYDPSFVTEPEEDATIKCAGATQLTGTTTSFAITRESRKSGKSFTDVYPWDALDADLAFHMADGKVVAGADVLRAVRDQCGTELENDQQLDLLDCLGGEVDHIAFKRRKVFFEDVVLGRREKPLENLRDFVIVRSDDSPVFHIANVVDDANMAVTHILRGNDHTENTFRHLFLFKALDLAPPAYGHLPMIVNEAGKPYSKRDGDAYVGDFREKGVLPEALFNFLALCGWSPGDGREKMSRDEMIDAFSLQGVLASPSQFDFEKLTWLNSQYIMEMDDQQLMKLFRNELATVYDVDSQDDAAWWKSFVQAFKERVRTLAEIRERAAFLFVDEVSIDWSHKKTRKTLRKPEALQSLRDIAAELEKLSEWSPAAIDHIVEAYTEKAGISPGLVGQPVRIAVTGGPVSPGIGETVFLLGRDKTLARLYCAIEEIAAKQAEEA